ncbi:MAG: adenine phosphoribosyltransferase [Candidatus Heimdallarchaeota archaeon]|nr:adenine phosphoribosyltransferase [Candidatus Heimdallarchaeota archaeon]
MNQNIWDFYMKYNEILVEALDGKPLYTINKYKFILNPLTEQVPATSSNLLMSAAEAFVRHMNITEYDKLLTEEDKGGILVAAVSLLTKLPFGMARWYPNTLANQISSIFTCEYLSQGELYICGIESKDRVCIIDDIISTGGTMIGMIKALRKLGAIIQDIIVLGEKVEYNGVERVFQETGIRIKTIFEISIAGEVSEVLNKDIHSE